MRANARPWMTALEMQFAALANARRSVAASDRTGNISAHIARQGALGAAEADAVRLLPRAQPYAWAESAARAVLTAGTTIPSDVRIEAASLESTPQWWWFDWPLPIPTDKRFNFAPAELDCEHISAFLVERSVIHRVRPSRDGCGLAVSDFRMTRLGLMLTSFTIVPDGSSLASISSGEFIDPETGRASAMSNRVEAKIRFIMAASVWLNQRVVTSSAGHIERHRRKQLAREYDAVLSDVKVVQLRRIESQPSEHDARSDDPIEWSCRWVVNGHWRNQYHPSTGKHELKYILPYVKGPADKPLKVPTQTVYVVNR